MRTLSNFMKASTKRLRANKTPQEILLWKSLKRIPVYGTHFRQQVAIGPYIVDFACLSAKLVLELDGSQHAQENKMQYDSARTKWLQQEGYRILRFWNNEIIGDLNSVLETIQVNLKNFSETEFTPPHPAAQDDPPPQGEGKNSNHLNRHPPLEGEGRRAASGWGGKHA